ncbi:MAG: hypothetical protein ABI140_17360 [Jatrophihabitantaceae bacterium]
MRKPKDWKRRVELRRAATRLRKLSRHRTPRMNAEDELRSRVHRYLERQARAGIDEFVLRSVDEVIESHIVEMKAEILHRHAAEDVGLGRLQAEIDGLITQYTSDGGSDGDRAEHLRYQLRAALRGLEDRDTPMPAGSKGIEDIGHQHGNVGELAGQGIWARTIYYTVLVLAMVADLITFRQVAERVVNDTAVFPLVLALTVTTTYVAHRAGEAFGAARQLRRAVWRSIGGWSLSAVWVAMGVGAFVFRWRAPAPVSSTAVSDYINGGGSSASDGSPALSAVLLLLLYLLTGAIALTAGYHRPRAEVAQYARTDRQLRTAEPRLGFLLRDVTEAGALRRELGIWRQARAKQYEVEVERCEAAASRAKADAAILARRLRGAAEGSGLWRMPQRRPGTTDLS